MKFLTTAEIRQWCTQRNIKTSERCFPDFDAPDSLAFSIELQDHSGPRIQGLASWLITPGDSETHTKALLWMDEYSCCDDHTENVCLSLLSQFRLARGETSPLSERPGFLFESQEADEMLGAFIVALIFNCWDTFLIFEGRDYFLYVSHEEFLSVVCRTQAAYDMTHELVKGWNPKPAEGYYRSQKQS
jgi:hypothetical protein